MNTQTAPASITSYNKYGLPKSYVALLLLHFHEIPLAQQDVLEHYQLYYWNSAYFDERIVNGTIVKSGIPYLIQYHHCSPASLRHCNQVALSFRAAKPEYQLPPIVLVSDGDKS